MNHSLPGVNAGHLTRGCLLRDHLRNQQQKISKSVVGIIDMDQIADEALERDCVVPLRKRDLLG